MAEIFVARMEGYAGANRLCVIKKIRPRIKADPRAVQMFLDEARIAATLQHPNIVQMFEVGEMRSDYFIAMEYLHGEDIRTVMKALTRHSISMPLDHAVHIIIELLAGLHHAHEKTAIDGSALGIVHRDVSPHNVFVTYDGVVKIVDFGIAKASNREHQTTVETLKGKIQYMSPEQCRCLAIDRRSDLFSAGVVLYEISTARRLNSGEDEYEIMKRTVEGPLPRPTDIVDGYPPQLESIVRMALEKKPSDRFQSALEMQQALENFAHEHRLRRSAIDLSKFMRRLFSDRIENWERGVSGGTSIRELVEERHESSSSPSEPTFESADQLDGPPGQVITLSQLSPVEPLANRSGPRRAPATSDLFPTVGENYNERAKPAAFEPGPGFSDRGKRKRPGLVIAIGVGLIAIAAVVAFVLARANSTTEPTAGKRAQLVPIDAAVAPVDATAANPSTDATDAAVTALPLDAGIKADGDRTRLRIRGTRGAQILIDGRRVGISPTTIEDLSVGVVSVELRKSGYERSRKRIRLAAGETATWRATLNKEREPTNGPPDDPPPTESTGDLRISSSPSVLVFVDGIRIGHSSLSRKFPTGAHRLRLVNEREGISTSLGVTVRSGAATKVVCKRNHASEFKCRTR